MQVDTTDGRRLERVVDDNWGSIANPMTPEQVQTKFRDNAALALAEQRLDVIIDRALHLDALHDVGDLIGLCCA